MASPQMVNGVKALSKKIRSALQLLPTEDLYSPLAGKTTEAASFLFELKVLFSLLEYLSKHDWHITVIRHRPHMPIRLPRSPGMKANFDYFMIEHKHTGEKWQIVHGTQVADRSGAPRAPDISLQDARAGLQPTYLDVKAIWDAKLRGNDDGFRDHRISDAEYRSFVWLKQKLQIPFPNSKEDVLAGWPPAFEVCSLITNGLGPTESDAVLTEDGASVTAHFADATTPTHPCRHNHLRPKSFPLTLRRYGRSSSIKIK